MKFINSSSKDFYYLMEETGLEYQKIQEEDRDLYVIHLPSKDFDLNILVEITDYFVDIHIYNIIEVEESPEVLEIINELNSYYRILKVYIANDSITITSNLTISEDYILAETVFERVVDLKELLPEVYEQIRKNI